MEIDSHAPADAAEKLDERFLGINHAIVAEILHAKSIEELRAIARRLGGAVGPQGCAYIQRCCELLGNVEAHE